MNAICPDCDGQKLMHGYDADCPTCDGTGTPPMTNPQTEARAIADVVRTIEQGEFYRDYDRSVADLRILREAVTALAAKDAELAAVKAELVRAWNAFGPPSTRKDTPAWDVGDLEHLSRSANGGLDDQIRELEDQLFAAEAKLAGGEAVKERRKFPILGGGGQHIDFELVADHGAQAQKNHYQSVQRLAERGGLAWTELYAVLHNKRWEKMDENEAMIACRALEQRYLSALTHPAPTHEDGSGEAVAWLREDTLTHVNGRKVLRLCSQYDRGAFPVYTRPAHTSGEVTEAMVDAAEAAYAETMRGEVIGRTHLNALRAALEAALRGEAS